MTEDNKDLRDDLLKEYKEALTVDGAEECLIMSFYKMKKISDEIADVGTFFGNHKYDVNTALVCMDILLAACAEVRADLQKYI